MTHARVLNARTIAWLPALLLIAAGLLAATGVRIAGDSHAATSTVTIGATVSKEVHVNLNTGGSCGTGTAAATNITGTTLAPTDGDVSLATCRLTFGSNNSAAGAQLLVESGRTVAGNSFCTAAVPAVCAAPQFTDVSTSGVTPASFGTGEAASAGNFGVSAAINAASCDGTGGIAGGTNIWGLPQNTDATPNGTLVCQTTSTTDGDVTMDFRVNPGSSQPASTGYVVQAAFTATAN